MTREVLMKSCRYFDTTTVLLTNPGIGLHTFLPPLPSTDPETFKTLTVIATKPDQQTLNANLFFIRVSPLSLRILTLAMAAVYNDPDRDWGADTVASSLQYVLEKREYRDKVLYQPADWFNGTGAIFSQPWAPTPAKRLLKMKKELQGLVRAGRCGQKVFPNGVLVSKFWDTVTEAKRVLNAAKDRGHTEDEGEFKDEVRALKYNVEARTWDIEGIRVGLEKLKARLGIGELVGFEAVVG